MIQTKSTAQVLIIFGPTGVGKSDLALQIAQYTDAEIVNMDMGQFYTPLAIGTAKPDWRNSSIPHHLFDIIDDPQQLTVTAYRTMLHNKINSIWKNKKLPIIVGGSGFYLNSLFFPPQMIKHDQLTAKKIKQKLQQTSLITDSWELLQKIDPVRAGQIDKNDTYRIERALTIWRTTGQLPSLYVPLFDPLANCLLLFVERDKQELYSRINNRVIQMIEQGWIDEVKKLQGTAWEPFLQAKKIIGYNDILTYLTNNQNIRTKQQMIKTIQKKTRNYAKRQHTFWRMLEKKLKKAIPTATQHKILFESTNLTFIPLHLYIKQLLKRL